MKNTANGFGALGSNTTGGFNTANGFGALNLNFATAYDCRLPLLEIALVLVRLDHVVGCIENANRSHWM